MTEIKNKLEGVRYHPYLEILRNSLGYDLRNRLWHCLWRTNSLMYSSNIFRNTLWGSLKDNLTDEK